MIRYWLISFIRLYQKFSLAIWPSSCRFFPSCSSYSIQSLEKYGLWKGLLMTMLRLLRCHPFHPGGYDPVK